MKVKEWIELFKTENQEAEVLLPLEPDDGVERFSRVAGFSVGKMRGVKIPDAEVFTGEVLPPDHADDGVPVIVLYPEDDC